MSLLRTSLVVLLIFVGAGLSGLLLLQHHGQALEAATRLCGDLETSGCAAVAASPFSSWQGVSVAAVGLFFYGSLLTLLLLSLLAGAEVRAGAGALVLGLVVLALLVDAMLLGVQFLAVGAFCSICLWTYAVNALLAVVLWPARRGVSALWRSLGLVEGRLALAGWALASLALALGLLSADQALAARGMPDAGQLLGAAPSTLPTPEPAVAEASPTASPAAELGAATPAASPAAPTLLTPPPGATTPPPVSAEPGELEAELARTRAELSRLQGILDDPQQLEAYLGDKALREFLAQKPASIELARTPSKGPGDAPVRVVEFSDFLCPFCRSLAGAFGQFLPQSQGRIQIYFKNYPLDKKCNPELQQTVHEGACEVALGAVCAHEQGRFWMYHDKVFSAPPANPTREDVLRIAREAGLDAAALEACLATPAAAETLAAQIREARQLRVQGTPSVFLNGKRLANLNNFVPAVNAELQRLGQKPIELPQR